jgi:hypothetical protein
VPVAPPVPLAPAIDPLPPDPVTPPEPVTPPVPCVCIPESELSVSLVLQAAAARATRAARRGRGLPWPQKGLFWGLRFILMRGRTAEQLLRPSAQFPKEATMETNQGNRGTKAEAAGRKGSDYRALMVASATIALFLVAIFVGTRHDGHRGSPNAEPAPAVLPAGGGAVVAAAPPSAKRAARRLEAVNRKELESTLPKGAPIDVTANDGDPEALRLAQEIRSFLLTKGYRATDVTRSVSTPPAKGVDLEPLADGKWRVIVGSAEE